MGCVPRYLLEMAVFHSKGSITFPVSWQINSRQTILIIACCVGFVLMVLLFLAFLLRGKVGGVRCKWPARMGIYGWTPGVSWEESSSVFPSFLLSPKDEFSL